MSLSLTDRLLMSLFSERERSEGLIRAYWQREIGCDLDENFAQYEVGPQQVKDLFDQLHARFGESLLSQNSITNQSAMHGAMMSLMRHLDAFVDAKHARATARYTH